MKNTFTQMGHGGCGCVALKTEVHCACKGPFDANDLGDVLRWLRRSVSNLVGITLVGLYPVADTKNRYPAANSAVHPAEIGK